MTRAASSAKTEAISFICWSVCCQRWTIEIFYVDQQRNSRNPRSPPPHQCTWRLRHAAIRRLFLATALQPEQLKNPSFCGALRRPHFSLPVAVNHAMDRRPLHRVMERFENRWFDDARKSGTLDSFPPSSQTAGFMSPTAFSSADRMRSMCRCLSASYSWANGWSLGRTAPAG